jgi:hypothetical protein
MERDMMKIEVVKKGRIDNEKPLMWCPWLLGSGGAPPAK